MKNLFAYITDRNFAVLILFFFCIQYIPLESREGVSYIKLGISLICPIVFLLRASWITRPVLIFSLYYLLVIFAAMRYPETLRWSTILFLATFLITFITFYNLVVIKNVFSKDFFINFLKKLFYIFAIVLIIQQFFILIGIKTFPLINLVQELDRGLGANSLSYEPSSVAIILSFAFLSLLRMRELEFGHKVTLKEVWQSDKWVIISFLYTMIGIVSGSAIVGLVILSLYFINTKYLHITIPLLIVLILSFLYIDFTPINRARDSFFAFLTLDSSTVAEADESASSRIIPIVNTLTRLDLLSTEGWFGHGVDYGISKWLFSDRVMIGGIADYGFLSFLVMQFAVYTCMIKKFFSIETLLWMALGLMTLANVPINWGAMMLFTAVRHFQTTNENYGCINNNCKL